MKKSFILEDLDCANCAAKIENAVKLLENVTAVNVSFMAQKMDLEAADEHFDAVVAEVEKIIKKLEPDVIFHK